MGITVHLDASMATCFRAGGDSALAAGDGARRIQDVLDRYGARLRPQMPVSGDPALDGVFVAEGAADPSALVEALLTCPGVRGAYDKPEAAPP